MRKAVKTDANRRYTQAHDMHYTSKDLGQALTMYRRVLDDYPKTLEAEYARSQIFHIVSAVVPENELLDLQIAMAVVHINRRGSTIVQSIPLETNHEHPTE